MHIGMTAVTLRTHFTPKSAFYKQKKQSACGIRVSLKKLSFDIKNASYTEKRILLKKNKKKAPAALGQALKNEVLMRIGMTAAQNDERGDQGLARTVDKRKLKNGFCGPIQHGILNGVRGTVGFFFFRIRHTLAR